MPRADPVFLALTRWLISFHGKIVVDCMIDCRYIGEENLRFEGFEFCHFIPLTL